MVEENNMLNVRNMSDRESEFYERISKNYGSVEECPFNILSEFEGFTKKIKISCKECNHIFNKQARDITRRPVKCIKCMGRLKDTDDIKKLLEELVGDQYTLESEYKNAHSDLYFNHKECGNTYKSSYHSFFTHNKRCKVCKGSSHGEKLIIEYLNLQNILYYFDCKYQGGLDCTSIDGFSVRFDFQLKNIEDEISGIIEFDGLQHYDEIPFFQRNQEALWKNDKIKEEFCEENSIPFLRISVKDVVRNQTIKKRSSNIDVYKLHKLLYEFLENKIGLENIVNTNETIEKLQYKEKRLQQAKFVEKEGLNDLYYNSGLTWKIPLVDFGENYRISNKGHVARVSYDLSPLNLVLPNSENQVISLCKNSKNKGYRRFKLIYATFNDVNYHDLKDYEIIFADGNSDNLDITNLICRSKLDNLKKGTVKAVKCTNIYTGEEVYYCPMSFAQHDFEHFSLSGMGSARTRKEPYNNCLWEFTEKVDSYGNKKILNPDKE